MSLRSLFTGVAVAAVGFSAFAFEGDHISGTTRQSAAEVDDIGQIAESDAKSDPKKNLPPEEPHHFRFNVGIRPEYTSNALLSGDHQSGDFLVFPSIEAGYNLPLGAGFAVDSDLRLESGLYARYNDRIFLSYSLQNTLEWRPKPNLPRIFVGAEPYRLDRFDGTGLITEAIALSVGTDWGYGFNNGNSLAFVGYTLTKHFSDPSMDSRVNHSATAGYSQVLAPKVIGQAYYQYQHDNYQSFSRTDSRHILGVTLTYQIDRHFFVTLGGSFVDNDSTQQRASYQSAGASLGINYQY